VKRRLVAVLAAVLSAALGAALLLTYVTGADRRAMAGMQPVQVLVTTGVVPAGTSGAALADLVKVRSLPATALVPGAVQDVSALAGLVSTADLAPGEQVLASRFVDPATLADAGRPTVPKGQQQVSVDLEPQRVLGGDLGPGARVAVFTTTEKKTRLAIRSALVLRVDTAAGSEDGASATAPADGRVRLVLAVTPDGAEALISGADTGTIWCSLLSAAPTSPVPDAAAAKGPTS
jgi:pilus assembly protein CpaB